MIALDGSIIPAILIFLALIVVLNSILFKPLLRVMQEREDRTEGTMAQVRRESDHQAELLSRYESALKNARLEGYKRQEQVRAEALLKRATALQEAAKESERLVQESRTSIQAQVRQAKEQLSQDARDIARGIASTILERSA